MIGRYYVALDPGGTTGTACIFTTDSAITGNSSYAQDQKNITGAAGAIVTIQVTNLVNTNGSIPGSGAQYNTTWAHLNDTFTVTLDGSGNGNFISLVTGNPAHTGTVILIQYTIVGVSSGYIGSPNVKQTSKVY
jgi:hypothetical protein